MTTHTIQSQRLTRREALRGGSAALAAATLLATGRRAFAADADQAPVCAGALRREAAEGDDPTIQPSEFGPRPRPDREFTIMLSEWRIDPGTSRPNPNEMTDFNVLTMNGKAFPGTSPLVVRKGQRVRIRIGNLSAMDHHPIHLHGYNFKVVATDGGDVHPFGQQPETTVLVPVGSTRDIEFVAGVEGDWVMHCHMTHHVMNQMGHQIPNMIGADVKGLNRKVQRLVPAYMTMGQDGMGDMGDMGMAVPANSIPMVGGYGPFDYITMGGMFTILKVRADVSDEQLAANADSGWYKNPPGTVASPAATEALRRDGIDVSARGLLASMVRGDDRGQTAVFKMNDDPPQPEDVDKATGRVGRPASAAAVYTCTMHPEVVRDKPGKCPKCGMKLVVKK